MFEDVLSADPDYLENPPAWYLSFVDTEDDKWLGACIVRAPAATAAAAMAHVKGCNPGGEVMIYGPFAPDAVQPEYMDRLLNRQEADQAVV
jgi:hypothetical protein